MRLTHVLHVAAIALAVCAPAGAAVAQPTQRQLALDSLYLRAMTAWQRNDLQTAKAILDSVIARNASHHNAYMMRADVRRLLGDVVGADADLTKVVRLVPNSWIALRDRGELRQALGDPRGKDDLARADELRAEQDARARANPSRERLESLPGGRVYENIMLWIRADSAAKRGDTAAARKAYDLAYAADSNHSPGIIQRGIFRYNHGDTAGARRDFTRAKALGDNRADFFLSNMGEDMRTTPPIPPGGQSTIATPVPRDLMAIGVFLGAFVALVLAFFVLWYVLTPTPRFVDFPKLKDEKRLWTGTPRRGLIIQLRDVFLFAFVLGGVVYVWRTPAVHDAIPALEQFSWFMMLFGAPFVVIGIYLLFGRLFADARRRKLTNYALTNQRAIVTVGADVESYPLDQLDAPTLIAHRDGTGTVFFPTKKDAHFAKPLQAMRERSVLTRPMVPRRPGLPVVVSSSAGGQRFERIPDAERVYGMLREAMSSAVPET